MPYLFTLTLSPTLFLQQFKPYQLFPPIHRIKKSFNSTFSLFSQFPKQSVLEKHQDTVLQKWILIGWWHMREFDACFEHQNNGTDPLFVFCKRIWAVVRQKHTQCPSSFFDVLLQQNRNNIIQNGRLISLSSMLYKTRAFWSKRALATLRQQVLGRPGIMNTGSVLCTEVQ